MRWSIFFELTMPTRNNRWEDHYARRARKEHFPARSVYKLKEMQQKYRIIKKGDKVLDLGCAPGSWLIYAAEITGPAGSVVGIDLQPVTLRLPARVSVQRADACSLNEERLTGLGVDFDVVLSDMAPATSGNKAVDAARSFQLCQAALDIARRVLKPAGIFVCKIFQGAEFPGFLESVGSGFKEYQIFKPQSSRKASKEIFIIGLYKL
jgi:23S rRNA (uridine2552-2'-O)-methyltransferase